jgi:hypothetical protein
MREALTTRSTPIESYRIVILYPAEPPRPPRPKVPWFGLVCIALAVFCAWAVLQLSPQQSLFAGGHASKLSQLRLPDSLAFLEGHTFVIVVSVVLALVTWALFRRGSR